MSESRKGIKIEYRTERFPTVKLTKPLMSDLLDALYEEYEKLKHANATFSVAVAKEKTNRDYIFTNKIDFLNEFGSYVTNFILIKISSGHLIKKIEISLYNHVNKESNYRVTSDDPDWSRNVRAKIEEVLEEYQTHYDLLHSRKSWIIWASFGIVGMMVTLYFQPHKTVFTLFLAIAALWGYAYLFMTVIRWLFPKFVIENTTQIRFRKWILAGLVGGTIVGVIAGLIVAVLIPLLPK